MSDFPEAKHAFAVNPTGPVPYSGYQVFGIFLVAFSPAPALAACGLRVYSRRLSQGLGLGEPGRLLAAARSLLIRHSDDWLIFLAAVCLKVRCRLETLLNLGEQALGIPQAVFATLCMIPKSKQRFILGEANVKVQSYEPDIGGYTTPISHHIRGTKASSGVT